MNLFRPMTAILGVTMAALVYGGSASAEGDIEGSVDGETGEATIRCIGVICEPKTEGCGEEMESGVPFTFSRVNNECTQGEANDEQAENLDQGLQTGDDLIVAAQEAEGGPSPAGGGRPDDDENTTTDINESNQNQAGDTGESDVETTIKPPPG